MYKYNEYDQQLINERVAQYRDQTNRYLKVVERVSHTWGLIKIGIKPIQMKPHYLIIFEEYEKEYTIFEFDGFH